MKKYEWAVVLGMLLIGIGLLVINFIGFVVPLRKVEVAERVITKEKFYEAITWNGEPINEYTIKVNDAIKKGVFQYRDDKEKARYFMRVPVEENYVLYLMYPDRYEFFDYKRAVERGVGLCSQQSIILAGIMYEHGIESRVVVMERHVVVTVQVDKLSNEWWICDPSYGVVVRENINDVARQPELIKKYYLEKGFRNDVVDNLVSIYRQDEHKLVDVGWLKYIDGLFYVAKWIIPLVLIGLPSFILYKKARNV